MKGFCITLVLSLFLSQTIGYCQKVTNKYVFKTITTENGLSNNIIYDIIQDKQGYIWIATDNGLNKYDGYSVKTYHHTTNDTTSLSSSIVRSLVEDNHGNIWIGTKNGLNLFDRKTESFKKIVKPLDTLFNNHEIMKMTLGDNGLVWVNTLNDVGFFNPLTLDFQQIYQSKTSLPFMTGRNKTVWVRGQFGELTCYSKESKKLVPKLKDNALINEVIHYGELSKKLWLPAKTKFNTNNKDYKALPNLPNDLTLSSLLEIDSTSLWLGTNNGLFEFNVELQELKKIALENSILVNQIRTLYKDHFGGIWIGTLGGVFHYDPYRKVFNNIEVNNDGNDVIMGLYAVKSGVYANALGKAIYFKENNSAEFKEIESVQSFNNQDLFVWDIAEIKESTFKIWMATNGGLIGYDPSKKILQKVHFPLFGNEQNMSFSILDTDSDFVWVAGHRTIHKVSKKQFKVIQSFSMNQYMQHSIIQKITAFGHYIFIGTEGEGLLVFDQRSNKISKVFLSNDTNKAGFTTPVWDLYVKDDMLWIGTNNGLYKLTIETMTIEPELVDNQIIFSIIEDDQGVLWMGSGEGLKMYDPITQQQNYHNTANGITNSEFNRKSVTKTIDGHLWFGGVNGITTFNPVQIKTTNPYKPQVHITELRVITPDSSFTVPHWQKNIVLPWQHNTFEINYVGINYTNPIQNNYKYGIFGYDPNWISSHKPSTARYVKMPVGNYTFKVEASNNDNVWNTKGDSLNIKILPPIWRTKWAYALYVLSLLGLVYLVRRLILYKKRVKRVELEKHALVQKVEKEAIMLNNKSKIYLNELLYIKSNGNYLEFITMEKTIVDRNKLKDVLTALPPNFVRIHKSYVINKNFIKSQNSTKIFLRPNIEVPLSRTFKSNLNPIE